MLISLKYLAASCLAAGLTASAVVAQEAPDAPAPDTPLTDIPEVPADGVEPLPGQETPTTDCVPDRMQANGDGTLSANGSLSDRLADCGGVLRPPGGTDPGIRAPAPDPDPGTTPVIPPSALPPHQQPSSRDAN
ncbi:hypothetical protein [Consotaella aegiceratis]|uniref:hypothetical protein n=1 Tax=Consotaella aegiceratis TaxID=3097961 RepID=UPI002F41AACB